MITTFPDWITAGTAVTAVVGGLFGVYTTTQSRLDVADERWVHAVEVIEQLSESQVELSKSTLDLSGRLIRSEVSAEYLKEGQEKLDVSLVALASEVGKLNKFIIDKHTK